MYYMKTWDAKEADVMQDIGADRKSLHSPSRGSDRHFATWSLSEYGLFAESWKLKH